MYIMHFKLCNGFKMQVFKKGPLYKKYSKMLFQHVLNNLNFNIFVKGKLSEKGVSSMKKEFKIIKKRKRIHFLMNKINEIYLYSA